MGSGKGGGSVEVTKHYLSMFWGICTYGRGIELLEVKFGDKSAWKGRVRMNGEVAIEKPDLFGGKRKEGGVRGIMTWLNGNANQTIPEKLARLWGKTSATAPGYRGIASIFLTGVPRASDYEVDEQGQPIGVPPDILEFVNAVASDDDLGRGFVVCANNPYLKTISARCRRPPEGLNPSIALIRVKDGADGTQHFAANAAHIIFEAMTNVDWGMGENYGMFNIASFEQCAQTLYNEKMGLNILWNRQSKIEDFIKIIVDHIQGAVFVDPATGKHTMKLMRADYEIGSLKTVSPSNAKLSGFKTKIWGDITNEVVVTWTNPETGKEETVTVQDLAGIAAQGGITSTSRNYHGFADQQTAFRAGERDLSAIAYPLASCQAEVTKEFWDAVVHDCVILNWPRHGIQSAVFRVVEVSRGSKSRTVTLTLMEDVFSLARSEYSEVVDTEWTNPSTAPQPLVNTHLGTAPAFMTVRALGLDDIGDLQYPEVIAAVGATADSWDDIEYELVGYTTTVTGAIKMESLGVRSLVGLVTTTHPLAAEGTSVLSIKSGYLGSLPTVGDFLMIGSGPDDTQEIAVVNAVSGSNYTLARGMLDTTPKNWIAGTRIMVVPVNSPTADVQRRSAFEEVDYHLRTVTSAGILPIYNAPRQTIVLSERPHLPNRPANVTVGGVAFGTFDLRNRASVEVRWANRNRLTEATQAPMWHDAPASLEPGQTTKITVLRAGDRSVISTTANLTGNAFTLARGAFGGQTDTIVRVTAVRDDLESLQGHEIRVTLTEDSLELEGSEAGNFLLVGPDEILLIQED